MSAALLISAALAAAWAGPLEPPGGAVAPTGKPLQEIEPRTAVQSLPAGAGSLYVISQPGSYYLTGNIAGVAGKNAIQIAADNVTLDLNGFAVVGVAGAGDGVAGPSGTGFLKNVTVRNGTVRSWPGSGIDLPADNATFDDLRVSNNALAGINTGTALGSVITGCRVSDNAGGNIFTGGSCVVERCTVVNTLLTGSGLGINTADGSTVRDCVVGGTRGVSILTGGQCVVERNMVTGGRADGINVGLKCTVRGNTVSGCSGTGILLNGPQCTVKDNTLTNNAPGSTTAGGIVSSQSHHTIDGNACSFNGQGIRVTGTGSIIIRNTARQNVNNYTIGGSNSVGPLVNVALGGDISANAAASHPWANFVH